MIKKTLVAFFLLQGIFSLTAFSQTNNTQESKSNKLPTVKDGKVECMKQFDSLVTHYKVKYQDKKVLFVFDIDNTIMVTNENGYGSDKWLNNAKRYLDVQKECNNCNTLHPSFFKINEQLIYDKLQFQVSRDSVKRALECHESCKKLISEQKIVNGIGGNSAVIALTSRGRSKEMRQLTIKSLKALDYQFVTNVSARDTVTKVSPRDTVSIEGANFTFSQNIIFTGGKNKGTALSAFMDLAQKKYDVVIFFDDDAYKVGDVAAVFTNTKEDIKLHVYQMKMEKTMINEFYTVNEKAKLYGNNGLQEAICKD